MAGKKTGGIYNNLEHKILPQELAAAVYRGCGKCKLKTKKLDILGGHCSFKGELNISNKKCVLKKQ